MSLISSDFLSIEVLPIVVGNHYLSIRLHLQPNSIKMCQLPLYALPFKCDTVFEPDQHCSDMFLDDGSSMIFLLSSSLLLSSVMDEP